MNADKKSRIQIICVHLCSSVVYFSFSGCGKPNTANIELRRQNQQLHAQVEDLNRQRAADQATIAGMKGATTVPTLAEDRIGQLFTVHGIKFGRLTGGADPSKSGD